MKFVEVKELPSQVTKKSEERLKVLQRRASKKTKGSNRQKKAYKKVAVLHEKIRNRRKDFIFKIKLLLWSK